MGTLGWPKITALRASSSSPGEDGVHPWRAQEHLQGERKAGGELVSCQQQLAQNPHSDILSGLLLFPPKKSICKAPPVVAAVAHYFMNIHASLQRDHYHHHQQKKSSQYHHLNLLPCRPPLIHHSL